jgi:ferric-dicitrate binding protein FerR (iron transport regulator)
MDNQVFLLLTARKLSGEASEQDIIDLEKLLSENDLFRKKYELLKAHWDSKKSIPTDIDTALQKIMLQIQKAERESEIIKTVGPSLTKSGTIKYLLRFSKVAAIIILCLAGAYIIYQKGTPVSVANVASNEISLQIQKTPRGAKSVFTLADGTKVIMNADSKLKYPQNFTGATREVYLTGEAFFDVVHNAQVPFIIHTDKMNIKVLGTEFNVKSYPEDSTSETTLIHGMVEVTLNDRPDDRIILKPTEKLIVSKSGKEKFSSEIQKTLSVHSAELLISSLHYISKSDSAVVETSWVDNKLVFQDESFGKLAEDMSRKYDVSIQFSNGAIRNFKFTGIFEKETITEALNALQLTEKFKYKIDGTTITIY